ncbi:MAG: protease HtpX [Pseudomonadota bacterium]
MMRIALFLATNIAVMLVASVVFRLLGIDQMVGGGMTGSLIYCAIFGMAGSFISLLMSKSMAKRSSGAVIIESPRNAREQWLVDTTTRLAEKAGIGTPEIGIFPSPQPNAFATGYSKNNALMAVSEGLLRNMSEDEVEAVIGHEIGHIANGDMVSLALVQGIVNTFVIFFARILGQVIDRAVFRGDGYGMGYYMGYMGAQFVLGILASIIVMWFSRFREFRADVAGAELAGRQKMIAALERLKGPSQHESDMPETLVAFGINGGLATGLRKLMMSHPPLEERIAALRAAA